MLFWWARLRPICLDSIADLTEMFHKHKETAKKQELYIHKRLRGSGIYLPATDEDILLVRTSLQ